MFPYDCRRRFPGERPVATVVQQRRGRLVVAGGRVVRHGEERVQLLGQGAAADPARGAVHHRLHAQATGRPGGDERLEVRGHGGGQVLPDRVHVLHAGRHGRRAVLRAAHNRRVTVSGAAAAVPRPRRRSCRRRVRRHCSGTSSSPRRRRYATSFNVDAALLATTVTIIVIIAMIIILMVTVIKTNRRIVKFTDRRVVAFFTVSSTCIIAPVGTVRHDNRKLIKE